MAVFRGFKRILLGALFALCAVFGANATVVVPDGYQQVDASYCDNNGLSILPEGDNCICVASGSGPADYTNIHWVCEDLSGGGSTSITINLNKNGGTGTIRDGSGNAYTGSNNGIISCTPGATVALPTWSYAATSNNTTNITKGTGTASKIFIGWSSSSTATSGTYSITCPSNSTLYYAVWATPTCNITGGSATVATSVNNRPTCSVTCNNGSTTTVIGYTGTTSHSYTCAISCEVKFVTGSSVLGTQDFTNGGQLRSISSLTGGGN